MPIAATANTAGKTAVGVVDGACRSRHANSAATRTATTITQHAAAGLHAMPAAVTAQLVIAAGTRRTSGVMVPDGVVVTR
jgi:hypothetical protein